MMDLLNIPECKVSGFRFNSPNFSFKSYEQVPEGRSVEKDVEKNA
jgi:hypothetical protein